jgi:hypothetical protein
MTGIEQQTLTSTVRFGRLSSRGFLLGFSGLQVACLAGASAVAIPAVFLTGATGLVVTALVWIPMVGAAVLPWAGRPAIETAPTAAHFLTRRVAGQTSFTARPNTPRPAGTLALPGDAAALRFHLLGETGAVMLHDPHARTLTAVAHLSHPAYVLLSPDEQARRVHGWGRALAGLAASGTCARAQILESALPDSGHGITDWWAQHRSPHRDDWPVRQYDELMTTHAPAASTHRTLIALSLDLRKANRASRETGRGIMAATSVLGQEMTVFELSLRAAELTLDTWLDPGELAALLRGAYDPGAYPPLDTSIGGRTLATAGPVAVEEQWDHLRHDTGFSTVLWVSEWPRIDVPAHFLHAIVFAPGIRKTLSITATPLSTSAAMRDIRKAKVEYLTDAEQRSRIGALADMADAQELSDVLDRERALIGGHADLRFTGLITVTAPGREELSAAVSQIQRSATQSGCETRILFGQQARAFTAAALPLARRVN